MLQMNALFFKIYNDPIQSFKLSFLNKLIRAVFPNLHWCPVEEQFKVGAVIYSSWKTYFSLRSFFNFVIRTIYL